MRTGRARRVLFILSGGIALGLAALGVVLPVLPTTPFLLLAAFCFARGSERVHRWLLGNRVFGRALTDYVARRRMSARLKAGTLVFLWAAIGVSAAVFVPFVWAWALLGVIGVAVSGHILLLGHRMRAAGRLGASARGSQRMPES